jgi:hypothetical protein
MGLYLIFLICLHDMHSINFILIFFIIQEQVILNHVIGASSWVVLRSDI